MGYKMIRTRLSGWLIKGISIGQCIDGSPLDKDEYAHAHSTPKDKHYRWICVDDVDTLGMYNCNPARHGEVEIIIPSQVLLEEYAHILTPEHEHDRVWKRRYRELQKNIPYVKTKGRQRT